MVCGSDFALGAAITIGGVGGDRSSTVTSGRRADATTPALRPGALYDVTLDNPGPLRGTLPGGWFADFLDVPQADIFHGDVEKLVRNGDHGGLRRRASIAATPP